jgi:hypothetical protein
MIIINIIIHLLLLLLFVVVVVVDLPFLQLERIDWYQLLGQINIINFYLFISSFVVHIFVCGVRNEDED